MTKHKHYTPEGLEKCLRHKHNLGGLLDKPQPRACAACNLCGKWINKTFYIHGQIYGSECVNILIARHNQPALNQWRDSEALLRSADRNYSIRKPPAFDLWNLVDANWYSHEPTETPVLYLPIPEAESILNELRKILNSNLGERIVFIKEKLPAFLSAKADAYSRELILSEEYDNRASALALLFAKSYGLMTERLFEKIPTPVQVELGYAARKLKDLAEALNQGRSLDEMFKTDGRYEGEICKKYGGEAQIAKLKEECSSIISKWRKYVIEQGVQIDFDKLLEELNLPEQSSLNVSPEGLAYAKDLDESNNFSY